MPATTKPAFTAKAIERPHYFPYRNYADPQMLNAPVLTHGRACTLGHGDIIRASEYPGDCFLVVSGALSSFICTTETRTLSAYYLPGSIFLELSALAHMPAALEYVALSPCELRRISGAELKSAMMEDAAVFDRVIRSICYKMYATREQQRGAKVLDVRERIYIMLLGFAKDRGHATEDGWIAIDWKLTQQDMGTMLSVNRVTVNTALQELYQAQVVRKSSGRYHVRDTAGLLNTTT